MSDSSYTRSWWLSLLNKGLSYVILFSLFFFIEVLNGIFSKKTDGPARILDIYIGVVLLFSYIIYFFFSHKLVSAEPDAGSADERIDFLRTLVFYAMVGLGFIPSFSLYGSLSPVLLISFTGVIVLLSLVLSIIMKTRGTFDRIPLIFLILIALGFYILIGPVYFVRYLIHLQTINPSMAGKWFMLLGAAIGFFLGCVLGYVRGEGLGPRTIVWSGNTPTFIVGLIVGFATPWLSHAASMLTTFLAGWLNLLLWSIVVGLIGGLLIGNFLGQAFIINLDYNRQPNIYHTAVPMSPAVIGTIIGSAACLFLLLKL